MKEYHHKTNACQNCCKTGASMADYIKQLESELKEARKGYVKLDDVIRALENDLPKEPLTEEKANLYAGGIHRAIYVVKKLESEGRDGKKNTKTKKNNM